MSQMTLDSIAVNYATLPPRIVIYGDHGLGKTTFGASAPNPIVLRTEDGLAGLRVPTFPIAKSYADVVGAINTLLTQEHDFGALVLDSLDWLEPLVWAYTAQMGGKASIEDFGYGKGYIEADEYWRELLRGFDALRQKGIIVILLAHAQVKRFDAPDTDSYDRYDIKLHKRAAALVQEWADVVGFVHFETTTVTKGEGFNRSTKGASTGRRILSVEERPAYEAKNRFGMPADLDFPKVGAWEVFSAACADAYAGPDVPTPSPTPALERGSEPALSLDAGDIAAEIEHAEDLELMAARS